MAAVCNSLFVLLWETMRKPVLVWAFSLVIGGRLLVAVSSDLTNIYIYNLNLNSLDDNKQKWSIKLFILHLKLPHLFYHSCKMWKEPRILLQHPCMQPHVQVPVWVWSSLWAGWCPCWGLWVPRRNPPELRIHVYPKGRVLLPLQWWYNTTWSCCYWWSTVVSLSNTCSRVKDNIINIKIIDTNVYLCDLFLQPL